MTALVMTYLEMKMMLIFLKNLERGMGLIWECRGWTRLSKGHSIMICNQIGISQGLRRNHYTLLIKTWDKPGLSPPKAIIEILHPFTRLIAEEILKGKIIFRTLWSKEWNQNIKYFWGTLNTTIWWQNNISLCKTHSQQCSVLSTSTPSMHLNRRN